MDAGESFTVNVYKQLDPDIPMLADVDFDQDAGFQVVPLAEKTWEWGAAVRIGATILDGSLALDNLVLCAGKKVDSFGFGRWKEFDPWPPPYRRETPVSEVFVNPAFQELTLLDVLGQEGGGMKALGREAVAALLNAASPLVEYPIRVNDVVSTFNCAVRRGDDATVEATKDYFEMLNEGRVRRERPPSPCKAAPDGR